MGSVQQLLFFKAAGAVTDPTAVAIYNALVAYWQFEQNDSSTQFLDSFGSNHLNTRNGGAGSSPQQTSTMSNASGIVNRCADFTGSIDGYSAYIPRSNTALDLPNSNWTFGGWMKMVTTTGGSAKFCIGRVGNAGSGSQVVAAIYIDGTDDVVKAYAWNSTPSFTSVSTGMSTSTASAWVFYTFTLNRSSNLIELRWQHASSGGMQKVTAAFASALYTATNSANFAINNALASDNNYFSGQRGGVRQADQCFHLTKAISDTEFAYLYNSGAGRGYASLSADAGH